MSTALLTVGLASLVLPFQLPRTSHSLPSRVDTTALIRGEEGRDGRGDRARLGREAIRRLYIQGVSNSGDAMPSLRYMRLQSLLPLFDLQRRAAGGAGDRLRTGITAGALLRYPDLNRRVSRNCCPPCSAPRPCSKLVGASTPCTHYVLFDGRRELQRSNERYDLITLEPPPPSAAGVVNLYPAISTGSPPRYSSPNGILAQWLPLPTQKEVDTRSLVRSFLDVFPNVSLWTTELHETLLVGSLDPLTLDFARIHERFAKPDVSSALGEVGVSSAEALLATYVMGRSGWNASPLTRRRSPMTGRVSNTRPGCDRTISVWSCRT